MGLASVEGKGIPMPAHRYISGCCPAQVCLAMVKMFFVKVLIQSTPGAGRCTLSCNGATAYYVVSIPLHRCVF